MDLTIIWTLSVLLTAASVFLNSVLENEQSQPERFIHENSGRLFTVSFLVMAGIPLGRMLHWFAVFVGL